MARNAGKQKIAKINQNATIGVLGAKGGVGTTTVAMNLGAAMLQAGDNPIVADFRPGFGSLGLMLGHAQSRGMAKLLDQPNGNIDADTVGAQVITHQSGLRLLLSSARPSEGMNQYAPENAVQIAKTVKTLANPAIYDLGAGLTPFNSRLIKEVDRLIIVVEPSRIALDMTRELFSVIEGEGVARAKMNIVIVSRAQSSLQTSWQEIEQALGQEIKAIISAAPELAFQANEAGVPMVLFRPNAITSSQLTKLAEDFKGRPPRPVG